mmetsp:Transcript_36542/g.59081  ORF Transcript_36542/g.59081 Transcript_36542/m.59081 type:complete len:151 (+) Transcript_36542:3658-4110(+)
MQRKKYPNNMIWLFVWTIVESYSVAFICSLYSVQQVLQAFVLTTTVFLALTIFCMQTKIDFSFLGAGIFTCLWILVIWGLIQAFFPMGPAVRFLYSLFGAILFCLFILFDTSSIMNRLSPDEYISACIDLYLDILNLFLFLLSLLGNRRN